MKTFLQIFQYFPYVLAGVVAVEQTVGAGHGVDKKALVIAGIQAAAAVGEIVPESHVSGISIMIDALVAALNKSSLAGFGKPAPTV